MFSSHLNKCVLNWKMLDEGQELGKRNIITKEVNNLGPCTLEKVADLREM